MRGWRSKKVINGASKETNKGANKKWSEQTEHNCPTRAKPIPTVPSGSMATFLDRLVLLYYNLYNVK